VLARAKAPRPPLDGFVEILWSYDGYSTPHAQERLMPMGTAELVINLGEDESRVYDWRDTSRCTCLPGAIVVGAHGQPFVIDTAEQQSVVGAHFAAGGAFPFFGVDASELTDRHVPLEALWGVPATRRLRERLLETKPGAARLDVLEAALVERLRKPPARHPAVAFALGAFERGAASVRALTDETGYSPRRFIELFSSEVGLTPKLYHRLFRFQSVIARVRRARTDWVQVALDAGYFDQAHLIRDFRAFSGFTPREYVASMSEHQNHVPLK
jgi:AraC-like DNA-binding protein